MDQVREESHLDVAEVDEKKAVDAETSIHDIELPKKQGNVGEDVFRLWIQKSIPILLNAKN